MVSYDCFEGLTGRWPKQLHNMAMVVLNKVVQYDYLNLIRCNHY